MPFVLVTLALIWLAVAPDESRAGPKRRLDLVGALLTAVGLAAPVLALTEQPQRGWTDPLVIGGLVAGAVLLTAFVFWERHTSDPMLPLGLFRRRNFTVANVETLLVYAGLSSLFFFLTIFLQQVAGWSPLESGLAGLPVTVLLFVLSRFTGRLSARFGPRLFMGGGPLVAAVGVLLLTRLDSDVSYVVGRPAGDGRCSGSGSSITVAPLTTTVMSDAHRGDSGIASGVNNAVARVAGLLGIAVVGVAVANRSGAELDVAGYRIGMVLTAVLVAAGGVVGLVGIQNSGGARAGAAGIVGAG